MNLCIRKKTPRLDEGYRKDDDVFMCYSVLDDVFALFTPSSS